jgi:hypothetical protein
MFTNTSGGESVGNELPVPSTASLFSIVTRATRLSAFLPIGRLFSLGITKIQLTGGPNFSGTFFNDKCMP